MLHAIPFCWVTCTTGVKSIYLAWALLLFSSFLKPRLERSRSVLLRRCRKLDRPRPELSDELLKLHVQECRSVCAPESCMLSLQRILALCYRSCLASTAIHSES